MFRAWEALGEWSRTWRQFIMPVVGYEGCRVWAPTCKVSGFGGLGRMALAYIIVTLRSSTANKLGVV